MHEALGLEWVSKRHESVDLQGLPHCPHHHLVGSHVHICASLRWLLCWRLPFINCVLTFLHLPHPLMVARATFASFPAFFVMLSS